MLNLKSLSNDLLWTQIHMLVKTERETTLAILWHLREVEARGLHLERGFSSMHDYATRELGYSGAATHRRVESMRPLRELPEMEKKLESGELPLSTVALVQGFFKNERKQDRMYTVIEKRELLNEIAGKSTREVEKVLTALAPESVPLKKESTRVITADLTELKLLADQELMDLLEKVKDLMGGKNAYPDLKDLLKVLSRFYLSKKNSTPKSRKVPAPENPENKNARSPSAHQKREVRQRAQNQCEYIDSKTGQRCPSRRNLEVDHFRPYAWGGNTELKNLQLLCFQHHRHKTIGEQHPQVPLDKHPSDKIP